MFLNMHYDPIKPRLRVLRILITLKTKRITAVLHGAEIYLKLIFKYCCSTRKNLLFLSL